MTFSLPYSCTHTYIYNSLIKIFRCGGGEDSIRLRCSDNSDFLTIVIENKGETVEYYGIYTITQSPALLSVITSDSDKVATFDMKLMDIDAEHLAIPVS